MEKYVATNPESLPLNEIKEGLKLLIVARQFPTRSGPIDVLAVDSDGDLYIIETKLFRNPDKRQVVAQVLDYGASIWRAYGDGETFLGDVDTLLGNAAGGFTGRLCDVFGFDDDAAVVFRQTLRQNVKGRQFQICRANGYPA